MKIKTFLILICIHFENDVENELKVDKNSELINYENFYRRFYLKQNIYIIDKTNTISGKDILFSEIIKNSRIINSKLLY